MGIIDSYRLEKLFFYKKGGRRIIFFRGSNFREITTEIKTTNRPNIKLIRNLQNIVKNYSICSKRIKEYFLKTKELFTKCTKINPMIQTI